MSQRQLQLQETLSDLIGNHGYNSVRKALSKMRLARPMLADRAKSPAASTAKRVKPNAVGVIQSLDIADDRKKEILFTLAKKYEAKEFMPNVNHVRDFLHRVRDVSRIKSRQQVTVAVFKQLAKMQPAELQELLDRGIYGPPKRLETYAKAIENFQRPSRSL